METLCREKERLNAKVSVRLETEIAFSETIFSFSFVSNNANLSLHLSNAYLFHPLKVKSFAISIKSVRSIKICKSNKLCQS